MKILMTGCDTPSIGRYMKGKLEDQGHEIYGMGAQGPDYNVNLSGIESHGMSTIADRAFDKYGPFDTLFCHAGLTCMDWIEDASLHDLQFMWNVNFAFHYALCSRFVKQVKEAYLTAGSYDPTQPPYKIVIATTVGTRISIRSSAGYIATKCALEGLVTCLGKELAGRYPITVIGVAPGGIQGTNMTETEITGHMRTRGWTREQAEEYALGGNLRRKATWDEVWAVYDFAINRAPEYMTGTILTMTNGLGVRG